MVPHRVQWMASPRGRDGAVLLAIEKRCLATRPSQIPLSAMAIWASTDKGLSWTRQKVLTPGCDYNQNYARRPVDATPDFYALWADGHGRRPSESSLYFCDKQGVVRMLPRDMQEEWAVPEVLSR